MKKFFTLFALAATSVVASYGQAYQQYFRVEFNVPMTGYNVHKEDKGKVTPVAAGMKDDFVYCNPEHAYLDFQATGNPMKFRTTTSNVTENSSFYLKNTRNTQSDALDTKDYPYLCDKIAKISAYSIPVQKCSLVNPSDTASYQYKFFGDGETYQVADFVFDRLPRNVAELKSLVEDENGNRLEACKNPLYVGALGYLVWPSLLDCSQDCRDMIDYLFGKQYSALNTYGISNAYFQDLCTARYGAFVDGNGFMEHYKLFQHFAGAMPGNQYKPNGKGYGYENGPYKVRIGWSPIGATSYSGQLNCTIGNLVLFPNPDETADKGNIAFENPVSHIVSVRSTNKNGWFIYGDVRNYFVKGKDMRDDDF